MTVLVVAAHPDDELLGCGGTVARLADEGQEVILAILGEGHTSRYVDRSDADAGLLDGLQDAARKAAAVLGAADVRFFGLPDNRFDSIPLLDVVKVVESLVAEVEPETIYTHHAGDLNIDHGITHRAVLTATRPVPGVGVRHVFSFEIPSSTEWSFSSIDPFVPTAFVNIGTTLERKIDALRCYDTEIRDFPHPRSADALRAIARRWGSVVGVESAEAFEVVRTLR